MTDRITQAEFARRHAVTRQAVNDWVARGVVQLGADGLLEEAVALAAIEAALDPARQQKIVAAPAPVIHANEVPPEGQGDLPTPDQASSFHRAKTRREQAEATMAELKLLTMSGELLDREPTLKAIADAAAQLGASLERVPDRLAPIVAAEADEHRCHTLLSAEMDALRTYVADTIARLGAALAKPAA